MTMSCFSPATSAAMQFVGNTADLGPAIYSGNNAEITLMDACNVTLNTNYRWGQ